MVPQVGQGALAVECRAGDETTRRALQAIEHAPSRRRVDAERAFLVELGGDCDLPAGAHATFVDEVGDVAVAGRLRLSAFLATDGTASADLVRARQLGEDPVALGTEMARTL